MSLASTSSCVCEDTGLPENFGPVVQLFVGFLAKCLSEQFSGRSAKEVAEDNYDPVTQKYDSTFVRQLRPQARRAQCEARRRDSAERKALSKQELDAMSVAVLERARTGNEQETKGLLQDGLAAVRG